MPDAWYEAFFDKNYLRFWAPLDGERAKAEVGKVIALVALSPPARILDLCCGYGRHSIELARRGFQVVGVDLSGEMLAKARSQAEESGLHVEWVQRDMRTLSFNEEFDAVLNLFTSFGYLESEEEDRKVLAAVYRALRPGGRFVLDFFNAVAILRRFRPNEWQELPDGSLRLWQRSYDTADGSSDERVVFVSPGGERTERRIRLRWYTPAELIAAVRSAGLTIDGLFGNLQGGALTFDSSRVVVLSHREQ